MLCESMFHGQPSRGFSKRKTQMDQDFIAEYMRTFQNSTEEMSFGEYLERCKTDKSCYASPAERLLAAIGEPTVVDTRENPRLGRIFSNRSIKTYPAFAEFFGLEEAIEQLVSYLRHSAQNLEESKSILYLLGPVGGGKSSIAEKLKELIEQRPVYVIKGSPVFESPLGLLNFGNWKRVLEEKYGVPSYAVRTVPSPWAVEKLKEFEGDLNKFRIEKIYPSRLNQICVSKVEPGDENNQDISSLVGKVDIRQLEKFSQNHPYAYSYSGGLCRANRGVLDFVEMFKAPLKMLHPLLTATQERNYNGTETIGSLPFEGIIVAHSNESEWQQFKNNKTNEAFLDRISLIKIPYCLRFSEEREIYEKLLSGSQLKDAPCAPFTLDMLSQFCVLSRLHETAHSSLYSKMRVYDGENIKETDPKAKPLQEYRDEAGVTEGMSGISTRFAFKILSKVFNHDQDEIGANPVHLMYVLENALIREQFQKEREEKLVSYIKGVLSDKYLEFVEKEIRAALMDSYSDFCQTTFERYFHHADAWLNDSDFRDPETHVLYDRGSLNSELEKIEKAGLAIGNPKEFRSEVVNFALRFKANNGKMPVWNAYNKMREVIERKVLSSTEEFLPIISFTPKGETKSQEAHDTFVAKMEEKGYTKKQTRLVTEWFMRMKKNN